MEAELARVGDRERLAPADRRLHGRPLHGRDAGHELRPRRHDRRGQGGHRRPRRSRASPRPGIAVAEEIAADPRPRQGQDRGEDRRHEGATAIFIGVEVDDAVAGDRRARARSSTEVCPVDIFAGRRRRARDRRGEPRRVRALRAVHRRGAARHGQGAQALRRRRRPPAQALQAGDRERPELLHHRQHVEDATVLAREAGSSKRMTSMSATSMLLPVAGTPMKSPCGFPSPAAGRRPCRRWPGHPGLHAQVGNARGLTEELQDAVLRGR